MNLAPPNGNGLDIGNFSAAPIKPNINVFLMVNGNGLQIEGTSTNGTATQPRTNPHLYCSHRTGYGGLNRKLASST